MLQAALVVFLVAVGITLVAVAWDLEPMYRPDEDYEP